VLIPLLDLLQSVPIPGVISVTVTFFLSPSPGLSFGLAEVPTPLTLGLITLVRVMVLIGLASLIWGPVGLWVGLTPKVARIAQPIVQFLAAFPANPVFPISVVAILHWHLNPDIWLSPLMVLGTQWFILFNVIAGASPIPIERRDVATSLRRCGWRWTISFRWPRACRCCASSNSRAGTCG
jgi:ABC-type anion transport system duplicated permease subunit